MRTVKHAKPEFTNSPFKDLKGKLAKSDLKRLPHAVPAPVATGENDAATEGSAEARKLFMEAVEGVRPISSGRSATNVPAVLPEPLVPESEDDEALLKLRKLVDCGQGFIIADTPEYIEGLGPNVPPELARRLHRGDFSVQASIDLHGFTVAEAREVFQGFLTESVKRGKRSLLIVHGRGLSSAEEPVIKNRIVEWLGSSRWRKWVIAYASARSCDGGAGATYVLLRPHPLAKSRRNNKAASRG